MIAMFERFEIEMTLEQARSASHQGQCDEDVQNLLERVNISRQLRLIGPEKIRDELREYGAWDSVELLSVCDNHARIIWIAACNIREEFEEKRRNHAKTR